MNYSISNSGYEIYQEIIFQFVLRRHITLWQFVGAALIVISIAIAKTPDILQIFSRSSTTVDDETVRASLMDRNDTKHDSNVNEDNNQTAVVNAIPLTAILLALVASCNSGMRSKSNCRTQILKIPLFLVIWNQVFWFVILKACLCVIS